MNISKKIDIKYNYLIIVIILDLNIMSNTLEEQLFNAVESNDPILVKKLISNQNLDVNHIIDSFSALELAIERDYYHEKNYTVIIELLVNSPSIIISDDIIFMAVFSYENSKSTTLKLLLDKDININYIKDDKTLLMYAIYYKDTTLVQKIINKGADVNYRNSEGQTALMLLKASSREDNSEICKLLLDNKADVDIKDYQNNNLIDYMNSIWTQKEILLVVEKFNINPLMKAIIKNSKKEILDLVKQEKYLNTPDSRSETAIFYCVRYYTSMDEDDILDLLLASSSIDLTVYNCDNKNILDVVFSSYKKIGNNVELIKKIAQKFLNNELYNKNLKIKNILNLYFPTDLVDNIIIKYSK